MWICETRRSCVEQSVTLERKEGREGDGVSGFPIFFHGDAALYPVLLRCAALHAGWTEEKVFRELYLMHTLSQPRLSQYLPDRIVLHPFPFVIRLVSCDHRPQ